jgi:hypothetical protein
MLLGLHDRGLLLVRAQRATLRSLVVRELIGIQDASSHPQVAWGSGDGARRGDASRPANSQRLMRTKISSYALDVWHDGKKLQAFCYISVP